MPKFLKIQPIDNVVTAISCISAHEQFFEDNLTVLEDISIGEKIATKDFKVNDEIIKYAHKIGYATKVIKKGTKVHVHNISSKKKL